MKNTFARATAYRTDEYRYIYEFGEHAPISTKKFRFRIDALANIVADTENIDDVKAIVYSDDCRARKCARLREFYADVIGFDEVADVHTYIYKETLNEEDEKTRELIIEDIDVVNEALAHFGYADITECKESLFYDYDEEFTYDGGDEKEWVGTYIMYDYDWLERVVYSYIFDDAVNEFLEEIEK